jgi:hypothetical protein
VLQALEQQLSLQDGVGGHNHQHPQQQQHSQQHPQQQQQQQQPLPMNLPALHTPPHHHQQQQQQQQHEVRGQGSLSRRQQRKLSRQRGSLPATAALVVGISSRHIVGGYSDSTIRLWHMDDVYLADLTEQLVTGQIQQSDLAILQEQLMPLGASSYNAFGSFNPFAGVSFGSQLNLASSGMAKFASTELSNSSPPLSPTGLAGQIAGQLVTNAFSTASQLLREGSGTLLGVELMQGSDKVRRRGCWCARMRDAPPSQRSSSHNIGLLLSPPAGVPGGLSSSRSLGGTPATGAAGAAAAAAGSVGVSSSRSCGGASPRAAAEAAVDAAAVAAGVGVSAMPKALQCLACGSQDQQLVRALKDFVAIRTVSNNKVRCCCCCLAVLVGSHFCTPQPCEVAWIGARRSVTILEQNKSPGQFWAWPPVDSLLSLTPCFQLYCLVPPTDPPLLPGAA